VKEVKDRLCEQWNIPSDSLTNSVALDLCKSSFHMGEGFLVPQLLGGVDEGGCIMLFDSAWLASRVIGKNYF